MSGIENALMSLETAVGILSSKKMVIFHSKANEFLQKRLSAHNSKNGVAHRRRGGVSHSDRSTHSDNGAEELVSPSPYSDLKQLSGSQSGGGSGKRVIGSSR